MISKDLKVLTDVTREDGEIGGPSLRVGGEPDVWGCGGHSDSVVSPLLSTFWLGTGSSKGLAP